MSIVCADDPPYSGANDILDPNISGNFVNCSSSSPNKENIHGRNSFIDMQAMFAQQRRLLIKVTGPLAFRFPLFLLNDDDLIQIPAVVVPVLVHLLCSLAIKIVFANYSRN